MGGIKSWLPQLVMPDDIYCGTQHHVVFLEIAISGYEVEYVACGRARRSENTTAPP